MAAKIDTELLEDWIDAEGLESVLDEIAGICQEKADHIAESYDDDRLAEAWEKAGEKIFKCGRSLPARE